MSPIDYPDLLERRGPMPERQSSRLLRSSRSRSRTRPRSSSKQRRSASAQPTERLRSNPQRSSSTSKQQRRSLSRPPSRSSSRSRNQVAEITDLRNSSGTGSGDLNKKNKKKNNSSSKSNITTRTPSPTKRRTPGSGSNSKRGPKEIINLVDHDDEDLDLLLKDSPVGGGVKKAVASPSPKSIAHFPDEPQYSDEEDEDYEEDEEEPEEEDVDAHDLLSKVKGRMEQQRLMEEVKELKRTVEKKNSEIQQLTGQLRMAISTKCDLVIAHTELERTHEMDLKQRDQYAEEMKKTNLRMQELRAEIEREFMNELTSLSNQIQEAEKRREEDLAEKDKEIEELNAKIQKMEKNAARAVSARPESDKVKYYKKKLGMYEDDSVQ